MFRTLSMNHIHEIGLTHSRFLKLIKRNFKNFKAPIFKLKLAPYGVNTTVLKRRRNLKIFNLFEDSSLSLL